MCKGFKVAPCQELIEGYDEVDELFTGQEVEVLTAYLENELMGSGRRFIDDKKT